MSSASADIQPLLSRWASLGIAFGRKKTKNQDIERTIIDTLPFLKDDLKLLTLLLTWLHQMGDLVHVERLKALAQDLPAMEMAFLGGIAEFVKADFRNWDLISKMASAKFAHDVAKGFRAALPKKMSLAVDYGRAEADPAFKKFGLKLPSIVLSDPKKLIPRKYIIEDNVWFGMRALLGANWRADVAYVMLKEKGINSYQLAKRLDCSYETAYRLKKSLDESPLRILAGKVRRSHAE